mgnify:CR=1 FL=1
MAELRKISCFGDARVKQYGQQFLDVIIAYCKENNLASLIHEKLAKKKKQKKDSGPINSTEVSSSKKAKGETYTTTFRLYADQMNRAKYYKLLAFGGNVTYDFQPKSTSRHSITPFRLTFNVLRNPPAAFDTLRAENPALYVSLRDRFIPAMEYT